MITDDNELAAKAANGDKQAFRVLLERHYDRIYRLALRYFGNVADAEDIAQDICVALPKKLKSFRGDAQLTSWLYRLVINKCRDHGRRQASIRALNENFVEVNALLEAGQADTRQQVDWLYNTLEQLSDDFRETAILVVAEDLTHAQAGEILGIKEATVSWRMHEIRKKLKALAEAGDEGGRNGQ